MDRHIQQTNDRLLCIKQVRGPWTAGHVTSVVRDGVYGAPRRFGKCCHLILFVSLRLYSDIDLMQIQFFKTEPEWGRLIKQCDGRIMKALDSLMRSAFRHHHMGCAPSTPVNNTNANKLAS